LLRRPAVIEDEINAPPQEELTRKPSRELPDAVDNYIPRRSIPTEADFARS
jgi:hypothetical protein